MRLRYAMPSSTLPRASSRSPLRVWASLSKPRKTGRTIIEPIASQPSCRSTDFLGLALGIATKRSA